MSVLTNQRSGVGWCGGPCFITSPNWTFGLGTSLGLGLGELDDLGLGLDNKSGFCRVNKNHENDGFS